MSDKILILGDIHGRIIWKEIIEKENPDILLIAGDFVDDGTTKEDMIASCEALGKINIKYGIYFAHGNHDKGYYGEKRGYSTQDLEMELTKNNVKPGIVSG